MRRGFLPAIAGAVVASALFAAPGNAASPFATPPGQLHKNPPPITCDPIDTTKCLLPFPDNYFTVPDASTPTGLRVHFPRESMPANAQGVHIDPTDWNTNDGFSPGSTVMAFVPGIDL
ncbi:MAG TPA: hypothetical protein VFR41_08440, partial [Acidimicrobiia bacterium]|nr:hypothetical protein [Acidimicrobiia bacterium]